MARISLRDEADTLRTAIIKEWSAMPDPTPAQAAARPNLWDADKFEGLMLQVRRARRLNAYNTRACIGTESHGEAARMDTAQRRIADYFNDMGIAVIFNGDPRGYAVRLFLPASRGFNTWGGVESGFGFGSSSD